MYGLFHLLFCGMHQGMIHGFCESPCCRHSAHTLLISTVRPFLCLTRSIFTIRRGFGPRCFQRTRSMARCDRLAVGMADRTGNSRILFFHICRLTAGMFSFSRTVQRRPCRFRCVLLHHAPSRRSLIGLSLRLTGRGSRFADGDAFFERCFLTLLVQAGGM